MEVFEKPKLPAYISTTPEAILELPSNHTETVTESLDENSTETSIEESETEDPDEDLHGAVGTVEVLEDNELDSEEEREL